MRLYVYTMLILPEAHPLHDLRPLTLATIHLRLSVCRCTIISALNSVPPSATGQTRHDAAALPHKVQRLVHITLANVLLGPGR